MSRWRQWIKDRLPPIAIDAIRDLPSLPPGARLAWWQAAWRHGREDDLSPLRTPLRPPLDIVTLCFGNIYRSPLAAALLAREASRRGWSSVRISSAGFVSRDGRRSPEDAQAAAAELGVSIVTHRSSRLTRERAEAASILLVMDRRHEALLLHEQPQVLGKVVRLWRFDPDAMMRAQVIHDPYGLGPAAIRDCYRRIERCVAAFAETLARSGAT